MQKSYYLIWKQFNKFYLRLDIKPQMWSERLTLFVAYLIDNQKQSSTVQSYISAIKSVLKTDGIKINEDEFLLNSLTRACKLNNDKVTARLPINKGMLAILIKRVKKVYEEQLNQPYLSLLFQTMLVTTYYGLFRVSKIAWTQSGHAVTAKDVQIGVNKRKFLFILRSSKTHGKGLTPQLVKIEKTKKKNKRPGQSGNKLQLPCLYALLKQYSATCPPWTSDTQQFFVLSDGSNVTATLFRQYFKMLLKLENFDDRLYTLHSIRSGRAGNMLSLGFTVETIKKLGRWKSNAVFKYFRN